jgi:transketolase
MVFSAAPATHAKLAYFATQIRIAIVKMVLKAKSGHVGGALGLADLYTALYFGSLEHRPYEPRWEGRDYVLVSNGHTCPVLYATLAEAGYFPKYWLNQFRQLSAQLQGHPHFFVSEDETLQPVPGVENTSGPLGQGLSQAAGLALGLKRANKSNLVFCFMSDGEHQEGQTWEAYMFANQYKLTNLIPIIDHNDIQISGNVDKVMSVKPLAAKLRSFGWDVWEIDGHDMIAFQKIVALLREGAHKPTAILAHTIPGKGVSFMERDFAWHGKPPSQAEAERALTELTTVLNTIPYAHDPA